MTAEHLLKILQTGLMSFDNRAFERLFSPEYHVFPISEEGLKTTSFLKFNPELFGFAYQEGKVSCAGVDIRFKNTRWDSITVNVCYDYQKKELYNYVLITPHYTKKDWQGRKSIHQRACKIRSDKDLQNYIKRLKKRFECPVKLILEY